MIQSHDESEYAQIIYGSPKIEIQYTEDNYSTKSLDNISTGELLLVEHIVEGSLEMLSYVVGYNKIFFDSLYPRNIDDNIYNEQISVKKTNANCYQRDNNKYSLGIAISKINHNCNPNCIIIFEQIDWTYEIPLVMAKVFAVKAIEKDKEITISYSPFIGHNENKKGIEFFKCECKLALNERKRIFDLTHMIADPFIKEDKILSNKFIMNYVNKEETKRRIFKHFLSLNYGILFKNDKTPIYVAGKRIGMHTEIDKRELQLMLNKYWSAFCSQYCVKTKLNTRNIKYKRFFIE
jgi:hypothetical protein